MITPDTLAWLVGSTLCVLLATLVWLGQRQNRALRVQLVSVTQRCEELCGDHERLAASIKEMAVRVDDLQQCQARMASRPSGGQRIENAIQIARHGAANEVLLRDLGLSDGEAALLLRLHRVAPSAAGPSSAGASNESAQGQNLAAAMSQQALAS